MAIEELDLEFEEDVDPSKKKGDGIPLDGTIEFALNKSALHVKPAALNEVPVPAPASPSVAPQVPAQAPSQPPSQPKVATVTPIKRPEAPASKPIVSPTPPTPHAVSPVPQKGESSDVHELREQLRQTQFNADVRVAVADFKAEILGEIIGDMKILELQIHQLLVKINAKHPDSKQEILMIKKILADFTAKKRK